MKKMILLFSVLLTGILLTACEDNNKIYTVDEFKSSKSLRDEYDKKCSNGELKGEAIRNCGILQRAKIALEYQPDAKW